MFARLPPVTKALLIANGVVFLLQWLADISNLGEVGLWFEYLMLWPIGIGDAPGSPFMPWQVVTYGFLHGSLPHVLFNMLALVMFGSQVEHEFGGKRYLVYYLACIAGAALCQLLVGLWVLSRGGAPYQILGASGAIYGLLLAFALLFPTQRITMLPFPIFIRARTMVAIYAVVELVLGINGWEPGVAHFAHLGGMIFGWLLFRYWKGPRSGKGPGIGLKSRKPRRHLRAVH